MKNTVQICSFLMLLLVLISPHSYSKDWMYTVRKGDTLWSLCLKYTQKKDCWLTVGPYNSVKYPKTLAPGTRIAFPTEWLKNIPESAEIIYLRGQVDISDVANAGKPTPTLQAATIRAAKVGDLLQINTHVKTHENSSATLKFADGSVLSLDEQSEITLDILSRYKDSGMVDTRLNLIRGAAKTKVPKRTPPSKFSISTPSAIAAVRGTDFRVVSMSGETPYTLSEVYHGAVGIGADKNEEVLVNKGFGIKAEKGKKVRPPLPLLEAPQFKDLQETQIIPITLNWRSVENSDKYRIELLQDSENDKLVRSIFTDKKKLVISELEEGCYRVRISAYDINTLQGLSDEKKVCAARPLEAPILNSEIKHDEGKLSISWAPVEGAQSYRVEAFYDQNFKTLALTQDTQNTTLDVELVKKKRLYFRVKAIGMYDTENQSSNTASWKPPSTIWSAVVGISLIVLVVLL